MSKSSRGGLFASSVAKCLAPSRDSLLLQSHVHIYLNYATVSYTYLLMAKILREGLSFRLLHIHSAPVSVMLKVQTCSSLRVTFI